MSNSFSKQETVIFEEMLEGMHDQMVLSKNVNTFKIDPVTAERSGDTIWRPMPYVSQSFDGTDMTGNFRGYQQLSVPARFGYNKSVPYVLNATELRDALQEKRLGDSAKQRLASDINTAVMNIAALQGTLVVKRSAAASGFDDVALCEAIMNETGVNDGDRKLFLSTRDYNGMASNLASRANMVGKAVTAYERAYVGQVASFDTFKMDTTRRLTAAAGGGSITISTLDAGGNIYTPSSTSTAATGEVANVDNRYQRVTVSSTTNVAAGDAFTIATLNAVHLITKQDTGQLKTFRVISVDSGTTMTISPPIITNQVASEATSSYQNCNIGTKSATSAIVFLNTVTASANPFWHKNAIELLPGSYAVPADSGVQVLRGRTEQGIELVMTKFYDIDTMMTKYRFDMKFGVTMVQPEMAGIIQFSQT